MAIYEAIILIIDLCEFICVLIVFNIFLIASIIVTLCYIAYLSFKHSLNCWDINLNNIDEQVATLNKSNDMINKLRELKGDNDIFPPYIEKFTRDDAIIYIRHYQLQEFHKQMCGVENIILYLPNYFLHVLYNSDIEHSKYEIEQHEYDQYLNYPEMSEI